MKSLKTLLGVALIVGGTTAVAVGQDLTSWTAPSSYAQKHKGGDDRRKKEEPKKPKDTDQSPPRHAPEIDGTSAVGALALLSGLLLVFRGNHRA
jgi:hypothetical protein